MLEWRTCQPKPNLPCQPRLATGFICELFAMDGCKKAEPAKAAAAAKPAKPGTAEKLVTLQAKLDAATDEAEKKNNPGRSPTR